MGIKNLDEAHSCLDGYRYSSYGDYAGNVREEGLILNEEVSGILLGAKDFKTHRRVARVRIKIYMDGSASRHTG